MGEQVAETSVVPMAVPALIPILLTGWGSAIVLFVIGTAQRKAALAGFGIFLTGVMTLVTSTLIFLRILPEVEGGFRVTALEIFTVGLLGFLGGALAMLGAAYVALARRGVERRRAGFPQPFVETAGKR